MLYLPFFIYLWAYFPLLVDSKCDLNDIMNTIPVRQLFSSHFLHSYKYAKLFTAN